MASGNDHVLQKVTFEIGLSSQDGAFEIQNRISNAFQSGILKELEKLFDRESNPNEVISIDKIEIELGRLASANLEQQLADAIEGKITDFLATVQNEIRNASGTDSGGKRSINVQYPLPGNAHFQLGITVSDSGLSQFEKFIHLLEYGTMPGGSNSSNKKRLSELIVPILSDQAELLVQYVRRNVYNLNIFKRLVLNLTKSQLQYLAAVLGCPFSSDLPGLIEKYSGFLSVAQVTSFDFRKHGFIASQSVESQVWLSVLQYYAHREDHKTWNAERSLSAQAILIVRLLLAESGVLEKVLSRLTVAKDSKSKSASQKAFGELHPSIEGALDVITDSLPASISGRITGTKNSNQKTDDADLSALVAQLQSLTPVVDGKSHASSENKSTTAFDLNQEAGDLSALVESGIYINNAGLIILAPYLKPFFSKIGLLEGKNFKDAAAAIKAVHLLQHICGFDKEGDSPEYGEHDLLFNKILCGINISEPVPEFLFISDQDKEECEVLLQSILRNWTILRNSSIRALQVTFFQKQGRLKQVGIDWDLLVERDSAVEILIDKLPWSISLLKLPWNDYNIHTQW